jgi:hypothetical protein
LFVSTAANDFHLQSGSPAIGLGKAITTVTSVSGSGTSFNVADANFFTDGFGMADGDLIKVGSNSPVRITSISGNTITVDSSISWSNGNGVYWRNQDSSPDAGAFEYRSSGYNYGISINSPANNVAVSGSVSITTTPINPELIRQVIFYINGVPVSRDFSSPFSFTWNTAGLTQGSTHVIDAVAYPLHASTELSKSSRIAVSIGTGAPAPACVDSDVDGYGTNCALGLDCNDANANIHPGASEVCGNGVDEDCSGSDLVCVCTDADWSHVDGACRSNNTLIRSWTKIGNCQGGVTHPASQSVACVFVPVVVLGDLNGDGHVNIADLSAVAHDFGLNSTNPLFNSTIDIVVNGVIDIGDLSFVSRRYTG